MPLIHKITNPQPDLHPRRHSSPALIIPGPGAVKQGTIPVAQKFSNESTLNCLPCCPCLSPANTHKGHGNFLGKTSPPRLTPPDCPGVFPCGPACYVCLPTLGLVSIITFVFPESPLCLLLCLHPTITIKYIYTCKILPFAATWMDLEGIMLSEIRQRRTNTM